MTGTEAGPKKPPRPVPVTIPEIFNQGDIRFVKVLPRAKEAFEKDWETTANYTINDFSLLSHLKKGGNYGIMTGYGNLCTFDADHRERLDKFGVIKKLDEADTLTVQRGDHRHYYFWLDGKQSGKHVLVDPNFPKEQRNRENKVEWSLGDVRMGGPSQFYTVGPGSIHPSGEQYLIVSGPEIKTITERWLSELIYWLEPKNIDLNEPSIRHKHGTINSFLGLRVGDYLRPTGNVVTHGSIEQGSHPIHGSTTGHNFKVDHSADVWACFSDVCTNGEKCVGGAGLEAYAVSKGLMECGDCKPGWAEANPDLFKKIIANLRKDGYGKKIDEWYGIPTPETSRPVYTTIVKPDAPLHPRIQINMAPGNWIADYIEFCREELPQVYEDFYLASALTMVSMATDRRVVFYPGGRPHYTVLWCMVLGKAAIAHKSDILDETRRSAWLNFPAGEIADPGSAAGLFDELSEKPRGYLIMDEASSFLSNLNNNKEAGRARGMLCRIYDCDERITKALSKRTKDPPKPINSPFLTMLWFIQPASFAANTSSLDIESGLLTRFLYFHPNYVKKPIPIKFSTQRNMTDLTIYKRYKKIIEKIGQYNTIRADFTVEAMKVLNEWQMFEETKIQEDADNPYLPSVFTRALVNTAKLAALITIADKDFEVIWDEQAIYGATATFTVDADNMKRAVRLMNDYFIPHALLTVEQIGINEEKNIQDRIIMKLKSHGGQMMSGALGKAVRNVTAKVLHENLESLEEYGVIAISPGDKTGGRRGDVITLLKT